MTRDAHRRMVAPMALPHSSHWGAFTAHVADGDLAAVEPLHDPDPSPLLRNLPGSVRHATRVAQPVARRGFLGWRCPVLEIDDAAIRSETRELHDEVRAIARCEEQGPNHGRTPGTGARQVIDGQMLPGAREWIKYWLQR